VIWELERKAAYLVAAAGPVTSAWRDAQNGSKLVLLNSTPGILTPWDEVAEQAMHGLV